MNLIIPPHPTPAVTDDERQLPVAVPVCVQEHDHYYPTPAVTDEMKDHCLLACLCVYRNMNLIIPPHLTAAVTDDERPLPVAVPVCVQEHEPYYPTPPHRSSN